MKAKRQHIIALLAATFATTASAQIHRLHMNGGYNDDIQLTTGWTTEIVPASEVMETKDIRLSTCWATCDMGAVHARPQDQGMPFLFSKDTDFDALIAKLIGDNWRLPTLDEARELIDGLNWTTKEIEGTTVFEGTKPDADPACSIVFPLTDSRDFIYLTSHRAYDERQTCIVLDAQTGRPKLEEKFFDHILYVCIRPVSKTRTQQIALSKGWNWISLNVQPLANVPEAMTKDLTDGDCIKSNSEMKFNEYADGKWNTTGDMTLLALDSRHMYQLKSGKARTLDIVGTPQGSHSMEIHNGWNWLTYNRLVDFGLNSSFVFFPACEGDIIKSTDAYSTYTKGSWKGTLKRLEPGKGYMLYSNTEEPFNFSYNELDRYYFEDDHARRMNDDGLPQADAPLTSATNHNYAANMTAALCFEGIGHIPAGARLVATVDGEVRGETTPLTDAATGEPLFMLTLSGDNPAPVQLTLYDGATEIATADNAFTYTTDTNLGTPDTPMAIAMTHRQNCVYPTPFTESLHIVYTPQNPAADVQAVIANASGQTVDRIGNCNLGGRVDITWTRGASLPGGVYMVTIYEDGTATQTFKTLKAQR